MQAQLSRAGSKRGDAAETAALLASGADAAGPDADGRALRRVARAAEAAPLVARARGAVARAAFGRAAAPAPLRDAARAARGAPAALLRRLPGLGPRPPAAVADAAAAPVADALAGDARLFEPAARTDLPPPPAWRKRRVLRVLAAKHARDLLLRPRHAASLAGLAAAFAALAARVALADAAAAARRTRWRFWRRPPRAALG